jgi:hypothetical protein
MLIPENEYEYLVNNWSSIYKELVEYKELSNTTWQPYNLDNGYITAKEWHKALLEAIEEAKNAR